MRKTITLCLMTCGLWTACADHSGGLVATANGPAAPINQPEDGLFPGDQTTGTNRDAAPVEEGAPDATEGTPGDVVAPGVTAPGEPTEPVEVSAGSGGAGTVIGGGGSGGGQPVPEPSTLLLVGSGLAGAALLRRRRKSASD